MSAVLLWGLSGAACVCAIGVYRNREFGSDDRGLDLVTGEDEESD